MRVLALSDDGQRRELKIEELWPHKGLLILKFFGVDDMNDAESVVGCELQVPGGERAKLEAGWTYVSDLVGCAVFDGDREIGTVSDLRFGAGEAPLLVVEGESEYQIPYAEAFLKTVDLQQKRIVMQLPEGLLDLSAPLTAEEKERQKHSG
jgi:16S rRNA processing protein RimM